MNVAIKDFNIETLHKKLGHIGQQGLETLAKKKFLPSFSSMSLKTCIHYLPGKTHIVVFKSFSPSRKSQII